MPVQKASHAAEQYATEDALFTRAMRYTAHQPTPNIWRKTAKRSVFSRIKNALLGYSSPPPSINKQLRHHAGHDSLSVARWLM